MRKRWTRPPPVVATTSPNVPQSGSRTRVTSHQTEPWRVAAGACPAGVEDARGRRSARRRCSREQDDEEHDPPHLGEGYPPTTSATPHSAPNAPASCRRAIRSLLTTMARPTVVTG